MINDVWQKIAAVETSCQAALKNEKLSVPLAPARDVEVVGIFALPPKSGLSTAPGQARLLHDLASIELQAMELGLRTLIEFPYAPRAFREQLAQITIEESHHLELCLKALLNLENPWGTWPVHTALWQAVSASDSLLDRILIVHRYLEGSGLDASATILRRLSGVSAPAARAVVEVIARDELKHVQFGSEWYRVICTLEDLDPDVDFSERLAGLHQRIPRRLEQINPDLRRQAGFSDAEIATLESYQRRLNTVSKARA